MATAPLEILADAAADSVHAKAAITAPQLVQDHAPDSPHPLYPFPRKDARCIVFELFRPPPDCTLDDAVRLREDYLDACVRQAARTFNTPCASAAAVPPGVLAPYLEHDKDDGPNEYIVFFSPVLTACVQSNTSINPLFGENYSRGATFYMAKYISKEGNAVTQLLPLLLDTVNHVRAYPSVAADTGCVERVAQHTLTRLLNSGNEEIAATTAALCLLGHPHDDSSDAFDWLHAPTAISAALARQRDLGWVRDSNVDDQLSVDDVDDDDGAAAGVDTVGITVGDIDALIHRLQAATAPRPPDTAGRGATVAWDGVDPDMDFCGAPVLPDCAISALDPAANPRGEAVPLIRGRDGIIILPQHEAYMHRPPELGMMSLYEFVACTKVVVKPAVAAAAATAGRRANARFEFSADYLKAETHHIQLRSKYATPRLTGPPPPPHPLRNCRDVLDMDAAFRTQPRAFDAFGAFYVALHVPWSLTDKCPAVPMTWAGFVAWFNYDGDAEVLQAHPHCDELRSSAVMSPHSRASRAAREVVQSMALGLKRQCGFDVAAAWRFRKATVWDASTPSSTSANLGQRCNSNAFECHDGSMGQAAIHAVRESLRLLAGGGAPVPAGPCGVLDIIPLQAHNQNAAVAVDALNSTLQANGSACARLGGKPFLAVDEADVKAASDRLTSDEAPSVSAHPLGGGHGPDANLPAATRDIGRRLAVLGNLGDQPPRGALSVRPATDHQLDPRQLAALNKMLDFYDATIRHQDDPRTHPAPASPDEPMQVRSAPSSCTAAHGSRISTSCSLPHTLHLMVIASLPHLPASC